MNDDALKGYKGKARKVLSEMGARVWAEVVIDTDKGKYEGIILPRAEQADDEHIVLKLETGYNIGLAVEGIKTVKEKAYKKAHYKIPEQEFPFDPRKPDVTLLGTGGTIASRLDYRTGAVIPAFTPGELYGAVPELADICNLKTEKLFGVFSENMGPEEYITTAKAIGREIEAGAAGIVIGHGTDTMHHTAAALTFMVQDSPVPIVMVGSQRSSDRPSSDAAFNLRCACNTAAHGNVAEVLVCMFGPTSDSYNLLHRGTRVRKMHSSYRSTFRTLSDIPVATCTPDSVNPIRPDYKSRRSDNKVKVDAVFDDRVAIVYYYPAMKPDIIESLINNGYKGIVIAGTGLGHVNKPLYKPLRRACKAGISVMMTVQTLWGYVQMYVYDTGRDLMELGIVPCLNMLPEVAYIKLGWVLAHTTDTEEVARMMLTPVNGEITEREPHDGYLVFQGGLPEIEDFLKRRLR
ncbi:Glu-tRNA(Gln) amidotransferase subunit GatD [candidate division WOR-3 bacterium]|uniref:Glu-tRNA(Gln) amidotransferase subunit GatD n=1 Tax=candidate division WOR-3 bacterium TaxID=2052148 RepID=A0A9D5K7R7_UNCW3|nr:Glu-tRNA(Gln) amidotransferase subunit GatD [candidate division WOR-3 bacterium]MBD3363847.1 Glu-tRNA(Gln) amidotransferase subunit GatD [candidate division WOR-3 bacterium]